MAHRFEVVVFKVLQLWTVRPHDEEGKRKGRVRTIFYRISLSYSINDIPWKMTLQCGFLKGLLVCIRIHMN